MSVTVCMERLTGQVTYLWEFQTNVSGGYQRERNAYNVKGRHGHGSIGTG